MSADSPTANRPNDRSSNRDGVSYTLTAEVHRHLRYVLGTSGAEATASEVLDAVSHAVRNLVLDRLLVTEARQGTSKRVAHIALSHGPGRLLHRHVLAMGLNHAVDAALSDLGLELSDLAPHEVEPSIGDGDPSRPTTSLLESLATLDLPATAYGLRFDYGQFKQVVVHGKQHELPDEWNADRSPWLVRRATEAVWIPVFGRVASKPPAPGEPTSTWVDWQLLVGVPWDLPVVGHGGRTVQRLRLFEARADIEIDVTTFGDDDFQRAVRERLARESVSKLLVPVQQSPRGQELRLLQEYFLVACSVRDILRVHEQRGLPVRRLPETHHLHLEGEAATLAIVELLRALVDEYRMDWDEAWALARAVVTYQDTLRPIQRFDRDVLARLLPRHLQILDLLQARFAGDHPLFVRGALNPRRLGAIGSDTTLELEPFHGPRVWLQPHNEGLSDLLTHTVGPGWIRDASRLGPLEDQADDPTLQQRFVRVRRDNKERAAAFIQQVTGRAPDPGAVFVLNAAPIIPSRRPLLGVLDALHELVLTESGQPPRAPVTFLFAGKANPTDAPSKRVIDLIHAVSSLVRQTPACRGWLDVHFVPNLDHRGAGRLISGTDVVVAAGQPGGVNGSIALAGCLHGVHTISSRTAVGALLDKHLHTEGVTLFGEDEVGQRARPARPIGFDDPAFQMVLRLLTSGALGDFRDLRHQLLYRDTTAILSELAPLTDARRDVIAAFPHHGARNALVTISRCTQLTSDSVALQAARTTWQLERC